MGLVHIEIDPNSLTSARNAYLGTYDRREPLNPSQIASSGEFLSEVVLGIAHHQAMHR